MKTHIDFFETLKGEMLASKRFKSRFKTHWGTEFIDGPEGQVEVFKKRFYVWKRGQNLARDNKSVQKILKMLGAYEDVLNGSFKGLENYYLWLNRTQWDDNGLSSTDADVLANKIMTTLDADVPFSITLNLYDPNDPNYFSGWTPQEITDYIDTNYRTIVDQFYIQSMASTITQETIAPYILLDDEGIFNIVVDSATVRAVTQTERNTLNNKYTVWNSSITIKMTVTRVINNIPTSSTFIQAILAEKDERKKKNTLALLFADYTQNITKNWLAALISRSIQLENNNIWYQGQLRAAIFDSYYLDRDFASVVTFGSIDTGYTEEKKEWWEDLIAIGLVIIAVVLAPFTAGGSLAAVGWASFAVALAFNLGIAALIMTGIAYIAAQSGNYSLARTMGRWSEIVSIVSFVLNIFAFVSKLLQSAAWEALKQEGLSKAIDVVMEYGLDSVSDIAAASAKNAATVASASVTPVTLETVIASAPSVSLTDIVIDYIKTNTWKVIKNVMEFVIGKREEMKAKEFQETYNELKRERQEQVEEQLQDIMAKEFHLGIEDIKFYTKPITADNARYEIDYLYEGTRFNIGRPSFYPAYGFNKIT